LQRQVDYNIEDMYGHLAKTGDFRKSMREALNTHDLMAFGVIDALKERGVRVPGDVSVHGFDDKLAARYFSPPLSTVALPLHEIGEKSADSVIRMAENGNGVSGDKFMLIPCRHVSRQSV
jgi:LacI family transcriptional regulator